MTKIPRHSPSVSVENQASVPEMECLDSSIPVAGPKQAGKLAFTYRGTSLRPLSGKDNDFMAFGLEIEFAPPLTRTQSAH